VLHPQILMKVTLINFERRSVDFCSIVLDLALTLLETKMTNAAPQLSISLSLD